MRYDKPNVFICGASGSGKSTSLRNLDPETTIVLNTEEQELPFRHAGTFKRQRFISDYPSFVKSLDSALVAENCNVIVIESFTSLCEQIREYCEAHYSSDKFAMWAKYKELIRKTLMKCKQPDRHVVFLGIEDVMQDENGRRFKTIAVQGSSKGHIEKEFQIVLWTDVNQSDDGIEYCFKTNGDGLNKAKSPMDMFKTQLIPNDINYVINQINEYYQGETT